MATITYTARRRLEKTGFKKIGVDISASPADDSFNASSTVLSGLLLDQWVQVAGFAAASNAGFFQLLANSTSGKITQVTPPITHLRLSGAAGNFASTPDSVAASVVGSIELVGRVAPISWTAGTQVIIAKDDGATNRDYTLFLDAAGKPNFLYTTDGTTTAGRLATATVAVPFGATVPGYVKATYATGTGVVQFFTSTDGVVYTQLGTNVTITAGAIHNGTGVLTVGANGTGANPLNGRLYYADVKSGIGGSIVAAFDAARGARGGSTLTATTGEVWTVSTSGSPPTLLQGLALATEVAGPSVTLTGYRRGLGQTYQFEMPVDQLDRSSKAIRTVQQPMDDTAPETILYREENYDAVRTGRVTEAQLGQYREFYSSVVAGELFTYDKYGTIAVPDNPLPAILSSDSYSEVREGSDFTYRVPFQVRVFV